MYIIIIFNHDGVEHAIRWQIWNPILRVGTRDSIVTVAFTHSVANHVQGQGVKKKAKIDPYLQTGRSFEHDGAKAPLIQRDFRSPSVGRQNKSIEMTSVDLSNSPFLKAKPIIQTTSLVDIAQTRSSETSRSFETLHRPSGKTHYVTSAFPRAEVALETDVLLPIAQRATEKQPLKPQIAPKATMEDSDLGSDTPTPVITPEVYRAMQIYASKGSVGSVG